MAISTTTENLQPHQVRAGRALASVTMEAMATVAGVSAQTILRIENGDTVPSRTTAARIVHALARFGVEVIGEGEGHGVGVRMREPGGNAIIVRRDPLRTGEIGAVVRINGKPFTARVEAQALASDGNITEALDEFDLRRPQIARAVAQKLEAGALDADGHIRLGAADLADIEEHAP